MTCQWFDSGAKRALTMWFDRLTMIAVIILSLSVDHPERALRTTRCTQRQSKDAAMWFDKALYSASLTMIWFDRLTMIVVSEAKDDKARSVRSLCSSTGSWFDRLTMIEHRISHQS